jgi:hypothetical protein
LDDRMLDLDDDRLIALANRFEVRLMALQYRLQVRRKERNPGDRTGSNDGTRKGPPESMSRGAKDTASDDRADREPRERLLLQWDLQSPIKSHGLKLTPEIEAPITWYTTSKEHRRSERPVRNTFENLLEVEWARAVLDRLERAAHRQARRISVAVIAGYAAQVKRLSEMTERNASDWPSLQISCNTVDAFQGKQADVCIYSVTLSNRRGKLRFLKEKPRLNVALSRARSALILIGDHHFCRTAKGFNPFRPVIEWVESHPDSCHLGSLRS